MFKKIVDSMAASNNTNKKEDKGMTAREKWLANLKKGEELGYKAANKTGYAVGYATETVKDEVACVVSNITKAVSETRVVKEVHDGYMDGKNNAYYDFVQRSVQREAKRRERADAKAMKQAVSEMLTDADIL